MQRRGQVWVLAGVLCAAVPLHAQTAGDAAALTKVLAELDAASARFQSAQADFSWDQYTSVVQTHDVQKGSIAFRRGSKGTAMVAHILTDNDQAAPRDVLFKDGEVLLYQPSVHQLTIMAAGPHREQWEGYSTLGFGSSGKELEAGWKISYKGMDHIGATSVAVLDLQPKQGSAAQMFTHIVISIDPERSVSLKQEFFEQGGDTRTSTFTNIVLNKAPDKLFTLNVPKDTTKIKR
jgi:outer membrane lipoprotein-sorting protein